MAVTLSGSTGTLYVNGQPVGTNNNMTLTPAALGATNNNWIGRSQFSADPFLAATVDDFQIYDHALSAADIAALASGQPGAGNVASYKFDEDSGETALDSSGNGHNATIISPGNVSTPLWQPVPDGPITVPAGSTNVPVTSTSGFKVGQKMAIGYGHTFETATVTAVGTPGTQARLAAAASAGATNIKVTSTSNITAGDTIRLDIGARTETVTVASVGTSGAGGTGLTLTAPLKFDHASNLPFSDRGTGITFSPATRFAHSSNEPVQALGSSITLDQPLGQQPRDQRPGASTPPSRPRATRGHRHPTSGSAARPCPPAPAAWCCATRQGLVADSLNYGGIVDPWSAEGYQAASGTGQNGCFAPAPATPVAPGAATSACPDGTDTDSNCADFIDHQSPHAW